MLVLALSLTAFHVKSKTRSSSSLPLSLFVKVRFLFLTLLLSGFTQCLLFCCWKKIFPSYSLKLISQTKNQESERPHDRKRQKDLARLYV